MTDPDHQLDELLRDVEVPKDLKYRLKRIAAGPEKKPSPTQSATVSSRRWMAYPALILAASVLGVGLFLWPDRDGPIETVNRSDQSTPIENSTVETEPRSEIKEILAQKAAVELALLKLKTQQLKSQLRSERHSLTAAAGHAEKMAIVLAMASQSSLEWGNDVKHVHQDLNHVLKTYPDTQGAARAQQLLQEY